MDIGFAIGTRTQTLSVDDSALIGVLRARKQDATPDGAAIVRQALAHPVGTPRLAELVRPGQTVAVVVSDCTRPCPTAELLAPVMAELLSAGIRERDIVLAVALGSHRPQTEAELGAIMGSWHGRIRTVNGGTRFRPLGTTSRGTCVEILEEVAAADVRIALGNVEYHYFAGYSGGAKAIVPGVASVETIRQNHSLMLCAGASAANMDSPVRADLEEACGMAGLAFILNVVLDEDHNIVAAAAGDYIAAHRAACTALDSLFGCPIQERADIVAVSQGGAPKDLNLYQLQKALDNAKHAVRDGGTIVLVGSCHEGFGEAEFASWMQTAESPAELTARLRERFVLGGHKAAAIAELLARVEVALVSDLPDDEVRAAFMHPYAHVQDAYDAARSRLRRKLGREPRVLAMPHGGSTLPLPPQDG